MGFDCGRDLIEPLNLLDLQQERRIYVPEERFLEHITLGKDIVVSGGHFPIGSEGEILIGGNAIKTMRQACLSVRYLRSDGYNAQLALLINDQHVSADFRREVQSDFITPEPLRRELTIFGLDESDLIKWRGHKKSPHYNDHYWEQPLANRFSTKSKVSFRAQFPKTANSIGGGCQKALVEMVLDFHRQGVDTYVGIFPGCSLSNVTKGLSAAKHAMPEMNLYALFSTSNCYD